MDLPAAPDVAPDVTRMDAPDVAPDVATDVIRMDALDVGPDAVRDAPLDLADVAPNVPCPSATTLCGGACVRLTSDPMHCGACGRVCAAPPGSLARCVAGACVTTACGPTDCDGNPANGAEVNTLTDACNCGACGVRCEALPGVASARCEACACRFTCHPTRRDCDGDPANGCEAAVFSDARNCGACGHACAQPIEACRGGVCEAVPTYSECGGRQVNLMSDIGHCGACDHACAAGQVCDAAVCRTACTDAGGITCGSETSSSPERNGLHCGGCFRQCPHGVGVSAPWGRAFWAVRPGSRPARGTARTSDPTPATAGAAARVARSAPRAWAESANP